MQELIYQMASNADMTLGEKILGSLIVMLFSMLIVFAVLALLMLIIRLFGLTASEKVAPAVAPASAPVEAVADRTETAELDKEVVAAITAAIGAMSASSGCRIVIRSIAKKQDNWGTAGILEQMKNRL